mgnify:CR=1 FL=1
MVYSPVQAPLSSPLDDAHSMLKYEIEVVNLQFNVEAETAQVCAFRAACCQHGCGLSIPEILRQIAEHG